MAAVPVGTASSSDLVWTGGEIGLARDTAVKEIYDLVGFEEVRRIEATFMGAPAPRPAAGG